ncbi:hypothetical protein LCGC14_1032400 [marine sediment metagenome]|uniref:Uncharacterized protein n=1 Tax=marine sediment metagenome TaxID=412755 RepID=A0A0F9MYS6_9ZZZZ
MATVPTWVITSTGKYYDDKDDYGNTYCGTEFNAQVFLRDGIVVHLHITNGVKEENSKPMSKYVYNGEYILKE